MNKQANIETPLQLVKRLIACLERHEDQIRKALSYGGDVETFDDICGDVLGGKYTVHDLPNSVLICTVNQYNAGFVYHVYIAAGDLEEILEFQRGGLIIAAKQRKCNALSFSGRLGWQRALINEGWKPLRITMAKEIPDG